ncbi:hypothetical protein AB0425_31235 [Actinosynnema sp. NPDC051121]
MLYLGGAVGTVLGGTLAQRWGRVTVSRWSYLATTVAVAGIVTVPGPLLLPFVALASTGLYVPFSLQVTLGQDYLPTRAGTASGVTLGLTVSVGGLAGPLIGGLADATSLRVALVPLALMPVLSWLLFLRLREPATLVGTPDQRCRTLLDGRRRTRGGPDAPRGVQPCEPYWSPGGSAGR